MIQNPGQIKALWLKRNPIGKYEGLVHLARLLSRSFLSILDLDNTGLFDIGLSSMIHTMMNPSNLKHLYLSGNAITQIPKDMFRHLNQLETLYIGVNRLGDQGVEQLVDELSKSKVRLRHFESPIKSNDGKEVERQFVSTLSRDLSQGLKLIVQGIYYNKSLVSVQLDQFGLLLPPEMVKRYGQVLDQNS